MMQNDKAQMENNEANVQYDKRNAHNQESSA